jgi:hypothetical protein
VKLPTVNPDDAAADAGAPPKSKWTTILTLTPVVLTVIATILAGLSSSEMTQAQYHRALAAQNQSKAGDQWNFFQAKRIRSTSLQSTIDVLQSFAEPGVVSRASFLEAWEQLITGLRHAEHEAGRMLESLGASPAASGTPAGKLREAIDQVRQLAAAKAREAQDHQERVQKLLSPSEKPSVFDYLNGEDLPPSAIQRLDENVLAAAKAIEDRVPDSQIAPLIKRINEETLRQAIETAEANILTQERADKPVSDTLTRLERLVGQEVQSAREFHRAVQRVTALLSDLPAKDGNGSPDVRAGAAGLARNAADIKDRMGRLGVDFKVARHGFTGRRYDREAVLNQQAASIYEIQVRSSSLSSENHRLKSRHFFFGMLAAQAGVTIASFALAVKYRNLLWGLASAAGVGAVAFSGWVFLR